MTCFYLIYHLQSRDKQAAPVYWQVDEAKAFEFIGGSKL